MNRGIGDEYHQQTKYRRGKLPGGMLDWSRKPSAYKEYHDVPKVVLPHHGSFDAGSLDEALRKRRSTRDFTSKPVSIDELSYILWATSGIQRREQGYEFRTAPSAGALYPIETYLVLNNVQGTKTGMYHYFVEGHSLELLGAGDYGVQFARAALDQAICVQAAVIFVWSAIFYRSKWKYRQRAYRYVYLDAGHMAENLYLASTGLGLGSCAIGALYDDELNQLLGLDGEEESAFYMAVLGRPAS